MVPDVAALLERLSGITARPYSTYEFGRGRDHNGFSVLVPEGQAKPLVFIFRKSLPPGFVAFVGTTRWLGDEKNDRVEVAVGKGDSQFDILRLARSDACNYDMNTEDIIRKLSAWDSMLGIDIFHAETDTIELSLEKLPTDLHAFAKDVYEFCPDIVDQGVGSLEALENSIGDYRQIYLWWD